MATLNLYEASSLGKGQNCLPKAGVCLIQLTLIMPLWDMRFWPCKTHFYLILVAFETGLTVLAFFFFLKIKVFNVPLGPTELLHSATTGRKLQRFQGGLQNMRVQTKCKSC